GGAACRDPRPDGGDDLRGRQDIRLTFRTPQDRQELFVHHAAPPRESWRATASFARRGAPEMLARVRRKDRTAPQQGVASMRERAWKPLAAAVPARRPPERDRREAADGCRVPATCRAIETCDLMPGRDAGGGGAPRRSPASAVEVPHGLAHAVDPLLPEPGEGR